MWRESNSKEESDEKKGNKEKIVSLTAGEHTRRFTLPSAVLGYFIR